MQICRMLLVFMWAYTPTFLEEWVGIGQFIFFAYLPVFESYIAIGIKLDRGGSRGREVCMPRKWVGTGGWFQWVWGLT